jgi:hypothetical protein
VSYALDVDTRVAPRAESLFDATTTDRWNAPGDRPNGGYLVGVCLQALRRACRSPIR